MGSAIRLLFLLPPVWITLVALAAAFVVNGWQPGMDTARYVARRLSP